MIKEIFIKTSDKYDTVDITKEVQNAVAGIKEGIVNVFVPHATASLVVNENYDPLVCEDIHKALSNIAPEGKWKHDKVDGNGAAHVKSAIVGPGQTFPVKDGNPILGTWQSISVADFDGPRERKIVITIIKA